MLITETNYDTILENAPIFTVRCEHCGLARKYANCYSLAKCKDCGSTDFDVSKELPDFPEDDEDD